jgi:hypothetical protein
MFVVICLIVLIIMVLRNQVLKDRVIGLQKRMLILENSMTRLREHSVTPLDNEVAKELNESGYSSRIINLPSGYSVEVSMFLSNPQEEHTDFGHLTLPAPTQSPPVADLSICPKCGKDKVQPVEWSEATPEEWEVFLRCGECAWNNYDVAPEHRLYDQRTVDTFDDRLDRQTEELMRDLQRATQANMEDEIDRFVHALEHDAIQPDDF